MWRRVLADYPYALILPESERVARLSGEVVAHVRGDWFVAAASAPPLYHELLGLPHSVAELERRLGLDTSRQLAEEKQVIRAGVRSSGVSQNNRALERHDSPFGAYWRSFDFRSNLGDQNIFANPLRFNAAGGEIIFNLSNGLQAYFLADAQGRRIDAAPLEIVSDRNQPDDPLIRNGRSCISCHFAGMKSFRDDVRQAIQRQGLPPDDLDIAVVKDRQAADLVIDLNRPLFTFDFTYSVTHRKSSRLVASGKVTAFDGNGAAPKIAKELIKQIQSARSQR